MANCFSLFYQESRGADRDSRKLAVDEGETCGAGREFQKEEHRFRRCVLSLRKANAELEVITRATVHGFLISVFSDENPVITKEEIPLTTRVRGPYCKLRIEFLIYGPSAKRAGHKSKRKKTRIRNLQYGPRRRG